MEWICISQIPVTDKNDTRASPYSEVMVVYVSIVAQTL